MKKRNLLSVSIIGLMILSCSSNEENNNENFSDLILVEWKYSSQTINGVQTAFDDECQLANEHQVYLNDGSYQHFDFDNPNGTGCEQLASINANWAINNNLLTVSLSGQTIITAEILELNQTTFIYKITNQDANDDDIIDDWITTM